MRTMKRVAAVAMSIVVLMTSGVTAKAAVTSVQPAKSSSEAVEKWAKQFSATYGTVSELKVDGKYIYLAENAHQRVIKVDKETGKLVAEQNFSEGASQNYYADIAIGDGKVYVGYSNGKVEAFDAETLKPVWITEKADQSIGSGFVYDNGKLYFGTGSYGTSGSYYVVDTKDEKPEVANETKKIKPIATSENGNFYMKNAIDTGKFIIISDTQGKVTCIDKTTLEDKGIFEAKEQSSGGIAYDKNTKNIYFVAGVNNLYSLPVNEDGTFGEYKKVQVYESGYVAMTPEVYNGRVYLSGTTKSAFVDPGYVAVVDVTKDPYQISYVNTTLANYSQCEFLVAGASDGSAQVYFTINANPSGIYTIIDSNDSKETKVEKIYEPEESKQQSCWRSVVADEEGTLYYSNDAGYIFAIGKKSTEPSEPTKPTEPTETTTATKPSATTTVVKPTTPVKKKITKTQTSTKTVKLTWKKNKSAKGYEIYVKEGKGKYKKLTTVGKTTKKTVKVKAGTTYKFKVKPYKYTTKKGKKVKKYYKTYAAKIKSQSKTEKVVYKNVTGYTSYRIDMKVGNGSYKPVWTSKKKSASTVTTLTYTYKNAKIGKSYKFRLVGIKKVNGKNTYKTLK